MIKTIKTIKWKAPDDDNIYDLEMVLTSGLFFAVMKLLDA